MALTRSADGGHRYRIPASGSVAVAWICLAAAPAMMGTGGSYARHALSAWACFVISAGPALRPALKWGLVAAGFALQAWLAWNFGGNRWVG